MKEKKFYTKNNREITYYGKEYGNLMVKNNIYLNIKTLNDLFEKLLLCYAKETAYPSCQKDYDYNNDPTYGQCAITAMIVNDIFGGTIHRIRVNGGTHYFNMINNHYIDLTRDQFTLYDIDINYETNDEIPLEYCGKNEDTKHRYNLLKEKLEMLGKSI